MTKKKKIEKKTCRVKDIVEMDCLRAEQEAFKKRFAEVQEKLDRFETVYPLLEKIIETSVKIIRNKPIG